MNNLLKQLDMGKTLIMTDVSTSAAGNSKTYVTEIFKREDAYVVEGKTVPSRTSYSTLEEIEKFIDNTRYYSLEFSIITE